MRGGSSVGIFFDGQRLYLLVLRSTLRGSVVEGTAEFSLGEEDLAGRLGTFVSGMGVDKVFVAVPRSGALTLYIDLPDATEENLEEVLGYELDRHTPYTAEQAYFDFEVVERDRGKIKVLLVVVPKKVLDGVLEVLSGTGVRPLSIEISSTALSNLIAYNERGSTRGLVCGVNFLSTGSGEVVILRDGLLIHSRVFSCNSGRACEQMNKELKRGLSRRGLRPEDVERIYMSTTTGPDGDEIKKALEEDFPEATIKPLADSETFTGDVKGAYVVPLGLALRGRGDGVCRIDLLPHLQPKRRQRNPLYTIAPLLLIALLLGAGLVVTPVVKKTKVLDDINQKLKVLDPKVSEVEKIKADIKILNKRLASLKTLREGGLNALDILKELTVLLPDDTFLTNLRLSGRKIEIAGYSASASSLIPVLENSPLLSKVEFSAPVTRRGRFLSPFLGITQGAGASENEKGLEQFRIRAVLEEEL